MFFTVKLTSAFCFTENILHNTFWEQITNEKGNMEVNFIKHQRSLSLIDWLDRDKPVKETEKEYPGRNEKQETVKSSKPRK